MMLKTWSFILHYSLYPHIFLVISCFLSIFSHLITDTLHCLQGLWRNKQNCPLKNHVTKNFKSTKAKIQSRPRNEFSVWWYNIYPKYFFLPYHLSMNTYAHIWVLLDSWPGRSPRFKDIGTSYCACDSWFFCFLLSAVCGKYKTQSMLWISF